jgi:hypothetical protein
MKTHDLLSIDGLRNAANGIGALEDCGVFYEAGTLSGSISIGAISASKCSENCRFGAMISTSIELSEGCSSGDAG